MFSDILHPENSIKHNRLKKPHPVNKSTKLIPLESTRRVRKAIGESDESVILAISKEFKGEGVIRFANRERHRKNQERYRLRQQKLTRDLDQINRMLRDEIQCLKCQRNSLFIGNSTHATLQTVVMEYFRVFRRGFVEPDGSRVAELGFLRVSMSPDLDAGSVVGFESLARNWGVFSQVFQDVRVQLESVHQISESSLVARTLTCVTITKKTLLDVFLCPDAIGHDRWLQITGKLLGQRLALPGTVRFSWNTLTHRVDGLQSQSDMISPLLQLLDNLEDISIVFSNARMTPECNFIVGDYLLQYPLYS